MAEGFDGGEFIVEGDVGVAVGVVEGGAEEDVDVGAFHEEGTIEEFIGACAEMEDMVGIACDAIDEGEGGLKGDDAFGGEVDAVDFAHVWNVAVAGALQKFEWFVEEASDNLAGGAAANDVLAVFGEKESQGGAFVVAAGWWAHDHVGGGVWTEAEHGDGAVVAKLSGAHFVAAFVEKGGGDGGAVVHEVGAAEKFSDLFDGPAVDGADADAGVGDAVAHHEQNVVGLDADGALVDLFVADEAHVCARWHDFAAAQEDA